ncbi:MAG: hypothetical protein ACREBH_02040 [Candidatus Micrarchaeaceae archaeon]
MVRKVVLNLTINDGTSKSNGTTVEGNVNQVKPRMDKQTRLRKDKESERNLEFRIAAAKIVDDLYTKFSGESSMGDKDTFLGGPDAVQLKNAQRYLNNPDYIVTERKLRELLRIYRKFLPADADGIAKSLKFN